MAQFTEEFIVLLLLDGEEHHSQQFESIKCITTKCQIRKTLQVGMIYVIYVWTGQDYCFRYFNMENLCFDYTHFQKVNKEFYICL